MSKSKAYIQSYSVQDLRLDPVAEIAGSVGKKVAVSAARGDGSSVRVSMTVRRRGLVS